MDGEGDGREIAVVAIPKGLRSSFSTFLELMFEPGCGFL